MAEREIAKVRRFIEELQIEEPRILFRERAEGEKEAYVDAGSLVSFVAGVSNLHKNDVLNSTLLAQLAANKRHNRENDPVNWYSFYREVLENVGWVIQNFDFTRLSTGGSEFSVHEVIVDILAAIATGDETAVVKETINAVRNLSDGDNRLVIFDQSTHSLQKGNFQISVATESGGVVTMRIGTFYFSTTLNVTRLLWFRFSDSNASMYKGSQTINLNEAVYSQVRNDIVNKLGDNARKYIHDLEI